MDFSPSPCRPRTPTGVGPTTQVPAPAIWSCWDGCGCNAGRARPAWAVPLPLPPDVTSRQRRRSFRELVAALYVYSVRFRGLSRILALLGYGVAALVVGRHHRLEDTFRLEGAEDFAGGPHDYADTIGKDHGCIEIRGGWTTGDPAYLAPVDPDREGCDRARLVGVRMQTPRRRPSHDRCPHLHCQPAPKARLLRQAVDSTGASSTSTTGFGSGLGRGRQPHTHGPRRPHRTLLKRMAHNRLRQDRSPGWTLPTSAWRPPGTRTTCANGLASSPNPFRCNRPGYISSQPANTVKLL